MSEISRVIVPDSERARYQEGMRYLQAGQWQEAIACFSELLARFPENRAIELALADARFKADLDASSPVKAKERILPWGKIAGAVLLAMVAVVAFMVIRSLNAQLGPMQAQAAMQREQARQAQLLADATAFLEAGQLDRAEPLYRELLAAVPDHDEALAGVQRVAEKREIVALYEEGVVLQRRRNYEAALAKFLLVNEAWPDYRDVRFRIATLEGEVGIDQQLAEAEAAYERGAWAEAIAGFERVKSLNSRYESEHVAARLIELYLTAGRDTVNASPTRYGQLTQARKYFAAALALDPRNEEALREQRLALLYSEGLRLSQERQWGQAIPPLLTIYENDRLTYMGGSALNLLYNAYVHLGDERRGAGALEDAYEYYQRAAALPRVDRRAVTQRLARLEPLLATPTPPSRSR